ncbi:hypothetical protein [Vulcanococcus sp.]|jgi:hypothetical protein|uniref:hypothetical protein n=1 Tax=Vulcanococcus sp. TaxID=2856995 RepID=UPI0037D997B5
MFKRAATFASLGLGLLLSAGQAALAQGAATTAPAATAAPAATPISQATLQSYIDVVSINMCTLLKQNVAYPTVYQSAVSTIAAIVINDNGSMIQGINGSQPLSNDQVFNGTALDLAVDNANRCPSLIPPAELQRLQNYIKTNKPNS